MEFSIAPICPNFQAFQNFNPHKLQTFLHHDWFLNLSLASSLYFIWPDRDNMMNTLGSGREASTASAQGGQPLTAILETVWKQTLIGLYQLWELCRKQLYFQILNQAFPLDAENRQQPHHNNRLKLKKIYNHWCIGNKSTATIFPTHMNSFVFKEFQFKTILVQLMFYFTLRHFEFGRCILNNFELFRSTFILRNFLPKTVIENV